MPAQNHFGDQSMQQTSQKIDQLQVTSDTLTSRGGLAFFVKYVEAIGILGLLLNRFARIKKSVKGVSVANLFLQALYFFFDGTRLHLCHFDELQRDQGYRAVVDASVLITSLERWVGRILHVRVEIQPRTISETRACSKPPRRSISCK